MKKKQKQTSAAKKMMQQPFHTFSIRRSDLEELGYAMAKVDDNTMWDIADRFGWDLNSDYIRTTLQEIAEEFELAKHKTALRAA